MNENPIISIRAFGKSRQPIADGLAALLSAGGYQNGGRGDGRPIRVILGERHHGASAARIRQEEGQSPFDYRPAAKGRVLLRTIGAEAPPYPSGWHYQPVPHARSLYDAGLDHLKRLYPLEFAKKQEVRRAATG